MCGLVVRAHRFFFDSVQDWWQVPKERLIVVEKFLRFMQDVEVVRGSELKAGYVTPGIIRGKAFESENVVFSQTRVEGGGLSGWHHHAARDLYAFVIKGRLKLEYGLSGVEVAVVGQGDFVHVWPGVVHRDVNPDANQELIVVNILVGKGDAVVNVDGP